MRKIERCIYALGLSFDIIQTPYWKEIIEEIGSIGIGLKQLSPCKISTQILKAEIEDIGKIKATHMTAWKEYGCTVMVDGWTDRKGRS